MPRPRHTWGMQTRHKPESATGETKLAGNENLRPFGTKCDVGVLAGGRSRRWVDGQLTLGMPHLRLGPRRTVFDLDEVRAWLKERYGQRRLGPVKVQKRSAASTASAPGQPEAETTTEDGQ